MTRGSVAEPGTGGEGAVKAGLLAPSFLKPFSSPPLRVSTGDTIYCKFCALKSLGKPRARREGPGEAALTFSPPRGRPSFREVTAVLPPAENSLACGLASLPPCLANPRALGGDQSHHLLPLTRKQLPAAAAAAAVTRIGLDHGNKPCFLPRAPREQ